AANVRALASAVSIPLICDADTGYGNPLNVWRTVREYEDAGAAALHIEDQVFPKKCGFLAGKQVIPLDEMVPKVRAACDARRNHDFVIIARTDALAVNGWDDVVRRCEGGLGVRRRNPHARGFGKLFSAARPSAAALQRRPTKPARADEIPLQS